MTPDFSVEKKMRKQGYRVVFGVDEVGIGPLAGPAVACAVTIPAFFAFHDITKTIKTIKKLKDSKQLSQKQRESFLREFERGGELAWEIRSVTPRVIDRINIYEARRRVAKFAVQKLERAIGRKADLVILDGKSKLAVRNAQWPVVKGDEKIALCAIASIIAKVTRDRTMMRWHKKYPKYRFDLHKGYGTKLHFAMLKKHGPSPIHRMSFRLL